MSHPSTPPLLWRARSSSSARPGHCQPVLQGLRPTLNCATNDNERTAGDSWGVIEPFIAPARPQLHIRMCVRAGFLPRASRARTSYRPLAGLSGGAHVVVEESFPHSAARVAVFGEKTGLLVFLPRYTRSPRALPRACSTFPTCEPFNPRGHCAKSIRFVSLFSNRLL